MGGIHPLIYRGEGGKRKGGRGTETEGGSQEAGNYTLSRGGSGQKARTDRSDIEMDSKGGGEAGTSQSHSWHKKGNITNIYRTDSDDEAIVDFLKDHEELYNKYENTLTLRSFDSWGKYFDLWFRPFDF